MASPPYIHIQEEYIRVFLHTSVNKFPGSATIDGLPREVWRTRVNCISVRRIECEGNHRARPVSSGQRKKRPGFAAIARQIDAIVRAGCDDTRIALPEH